MTEDDLRFRDAAPADLPTLHALIESAYRGESARAGWTHEADLIEGPRTSIAELSAIVADADSLLLVVERAGAIIGCVQLSRRAPDSAYLGMLTIDPGQQAGGLGKRLMVAAEAEAMRRFGARRMELTVVAGRVELIAFYERRGYAATGEIRPFPIALVPPLALAVLEKPLVGALTGAC